MIQESTFTVLEKFKRGSITPFAAVRRPTTVGPAYAATEYLTGKAVPTPAALPGPTIIVMKLAVAIGFCPGIVFAVPSRTIRTPPSAAVDR